MDHHPEAIARKRAERARRKHEASAMPLEEDPVNTKEAIVRRSWMPVNSHASAGARRVRIVSWNMLAQCLVRRELFPGSDCLKLRTRLPGIVAELTESEYDIGCFQEVDSLEDIGPPLTRAGYDYVYERGYKEKKHGLMIAWRQSPGARTSFGAPVFRKMVRLDEAMLTQGTSSLTRITRNIMLILALPFSSGDGGVLVATAHLFWHPRYAFERARQAAVIMQELNALRRGQEAWASWPVVLAGDLNDQPHSSTYSLLTGQAERYRDRIWTDLMPSRVVHTSVDELRGLRTVHYASTVTESGDEDRVLGRHRPPEDEELCTPDDLIQLAQLSSTRPHFQSAYGSAYDQLAPHAEFFCDRGTAPERYDQTESPMPTDPRQLQSHEPKWTLHSTLFRLSLDYILVAPRLDKADVPVITALLPLHPEHVLQPGIPRQKVCSSDHVMLGAEVAL